MLTVIIGTVFPWLSVSNINFNINFFFSLDDFIKQKQNLNNFATFYPTIQNLVIKPQGPPGTFRLSHPTGFQFEFQPLSIQIPDEDAPLRDLLFVLVVVGHSVLEGQHDVDLAKAIPKIQSVNLRFYLKTLS